MFAGKQDRNLRVSVRRAYENIARRASTTCAQGSSNLRWIV